MMDIFSSYFLSYLYISTYLYLAIQNIVHHIGILTLFDLVFEYSKLIFCGICAKLFICVSENVKLYFSAGY